MGEVWFRGYPPGSVDAVEKYTCGCCCHEWEEGGSEDGTGCVCINGIGGSACISFHSQSTLPLSRHCSSSSSSPSSPHGIPLEVRSTGDDIQVLGNDSPVQPVTDVSLVKALAGQMAVQVSSSNSWPTLAGLLQRASWALTSLFMY